MDASATARAPIALDSIISPNACLPSADTVQAVPVVFTGILPDLFREGKGVVAQGRIGADGTFQAKEVLAKHDENYMPPEAADALRKAGHPIDKAAFAGQKARP